MREKGARKEKHAKRVKRKERFAEAEKRNAAEVGVKRGEEDNKWLSVFSASTDAVISIAAFTVCASHSPALGPRTTALTTS